VVLVEDEQPVRQAVERALRRDGISVTGFADYPDPNLILAAAPDLAVLDVLLPSGDGFELARKLRAASDLPILFLTGWTASSSAPTTTWSSRSRSKSCSPACAPCFGEQAASARRSKPATSSSTSRPAWPLEPVRRSS
jgi:hypothetical protein